MKQSNFYCMRYYVTYRCNSRCSYCNVWRNQKLQITEELSAESAKALIAQCYEVGVRYIDFTGGEPTLYPHLVEIILFAKSLGIKTEVTSNCVAKNQSTLLNVARCVDKFNVSLDTLNPKLYSHIRGVDFHNDVIEAIETVSKKRTVKIIMVVSADNIHELDNMIEYAKSQKSEIYLSPRFPYFDDNGCYYSAKYVSEILSKIYAPYSVVMLHFIEFFINSKPSNIPCCSANKMTLTFAPDGSMTVPCYYAAEKKLIWNYNLKQLLSSDLFCDYKKTSGKLPSCYGCSAIPYMGISFNFRLDGYFLMQSYSEKLNHMKRDFLNKLSELRIDKTKLLAHLYELMHIIRFTVTDKRDELGNLYDAIKTDAGYKTMIYRNPISEEQYGKDMVAEDCWQLELLPHKLFDIIYESVYKNAYSAYLIGQNTESVIKIFNKAEEFQLRLWKFYISKYMNTKYDYDFSADGAWLNSYFSIMLDWCQETNNDDIACTVNMIAAELGIIQGA